MRKLIGPHLGGAWTSKIDIVRRWQPSFILLLQPDKDQVRQLRDIAPEAIIVGRFFHDDSHYASNINSRPKEFAHEIHQEIVNHPATPLLDYVQSNNETNQDWEGIQKLNTYSQEWMHLADQSGVYKCAILAFSVGNPDLPNKPGDPAGFDGKMLYWQQVLPSLNYAQQRNHILLMHAYGFPDMFHPNAAWYIYRYEQQVIANLRTLGITNLKYAYGEIGIDRLIVNGKGGYKSVPTEDQNYVNQLLQWERDLQGEDLLLGGAIFTFGDSGGWESYDITTTDAANMMAAHYESHAADYDGASNPDDDSDNQVFIPAVGTGGNEVILPPNPRPPLVWDDRLAQRGIQLTQYVPQPGDKGYWAITVGEYWEEKEHTFAVTLKDGARHAGVTMRWWWADGKEDKRTEAKPNDRWMIDFAMFAHSCSYGLKVLDGPSDSVFCMGLGSVEQPDWNIHVSYWFEFTWVPLDPDSVVVPVNPAPPVMPEPTPRFSLNDTVYTGSHVNLRKTPGYSNKPAGDIINTLDPGTAVKLESGPQVVDGLVWWGTTQHGQGWIAENGPSGGVLLTKAPPSVLPAELPILRHPIHESSSVPVSQLFGENEEFYKQFIYDGVPLMGHNGVDFAVVVGTQVVATDRGVCTKVGDEGNTGFGRYIILSHDWGDSLYAHLSAVFVVEGDVVEQGEVIALSGNTGTSTGPHLHFGVRKKGYKRSDGWGGYSNPLPHIGPHKDNARIDDIAVEAATEFGVDADLFLNLLYAENKLHDDNHPSSAGAIGPAQIMPATWAEWAPRVGAKNITNPKDNVRVGARYLKWCLDQWKNDPKQVFKALCSYNFGIGRVRSGETIPIETLVYAHSIIHGSGFAKRMRELA